MGKLLFAFRTLVGQHKEIAQGLQQGPDAPYPLRRRVVHSQKSSEIPVLFHGRGHQAADTLGTQQFIFLGIAFLYIFYVLKYDTLLAVEYGHPAFNGGQWDTLQVFFLGVNPVFAPFKIIIQQTVSQHGQIGTVCREKASQVFQHHGGGQRHVRLPVHDTHTLHDHLFRVQGVLKRLLFRFRFRDIKSDLYPCRAAVPLQQPVLQQIMPLCNGGCKFPGIILSRHQK